MQEFKDLHNIQKSREDLQKHFNFIFSSLKTFARHYHINNQRLALELYMKCDANKKKLPRNDRKTFSHSTASSLVPNMKYKTNIVDLMALSHYIYNDFSEQQISETATCGNILKFWIGTDDKGNRHHTLKNFKSAFCDFKYCPNRQSHNAHEREQSIYNQLIYWYDKKSWIPLFLTLTMPSVKPTPASVTKAIKHLNASWKRMAKNPRYNGDNRKNKANKGIFKGWISKIEHTFCDKPWRKAYGLLHYHIHITVLVRKSYLSKQGSKYFVTRKQILKDWRKATGDNSIKMVGIEVPYYKKKVHQQKYGKKVVKINKITLNQASGNKKAQRKIFQHSAKEIAKYTGKATDYGKLPQLHKKTNRDKLDKKALKINKNKTITKSQIQGVKVHYRHKFHENISNNEAKEIFSNVTYQTPSNRLKHNRKYLVTKSLSKRQLLSVKAFHAVVNGEKNQKLIQHGGWFAWSNKLYKANKLKFYDKSSEKENYYNKQKPNIYYAYKIKSKYSYKYHDYEDYKAPFNNIEIIKMVKNGILINHKVLEHQRKYNIQHGLEWLQEAV